MDGEQYGPFSATQIVNQYLDAMEDVGDVEVMEESLNMWCKATDYPWDELVLKETGGGISTSGEVVSANNGRSTSRTYSDSSNSSQSNAAYMMFVLWLLGIMGFFGYYMIAEFIIPLTKPSLSSSFASGDVYGLWDQGLYMWNNKSIFANIDYNTWKIFWAIATGGMGLMILGSIILAFKSRHGLSLMGTAAMILSVVFIVMSAKYHVPFNTFLIYFIPGLLAPIITALLMQIRENGVSLWDSMRD